MRRLLLATTATSLSLGLAPVAQAQVTGSQSPPPGPVSAADTTAADKAASGWSFKPRGRLQLDAGTVGVPDGILGVNTGFEGEVRRAYLGFDAKIPGGFSLRAEVDVASGTVEFTDLYLSYKASDSLTLTAGQVKPFWGLEQMTSDLFTSFTERAALNSTFGDDRQLGASAAFSHGPVLAQIGIFTANVIDLDEDGKQPVSLHGRLVYMPKIGDAQLHFAGSIHSRKLNNAGPGVTYRVRPFIHTPDTRFISTGAITQAESELGIGLEAAWIGGPFHATGEARWQQVDRMGALADPSFFGAYAEIGYFLTQGDTRGYKSGTFDRIKPQSPLGSGGIGAVQVNLRYDHLDLVDAGFVGGKQDGLAIALVWTPTDNTRMMLNYGRMSYSQAALPATGGVRDYTVDAFGMRAQFDF
jgi:phosphate-selective porin OprO/OprP